MPTTLNKTNTGSATVEAYAEAWRNKQAADKALKEQADAMQALLESQPLSYTYADGAIVDFKLVEGHRTNPVGYIEAQALTGFGEANMRKIAGKVDADAVKSMVKLGKLDAAVAERLLPTAPYLQVRGTFRKE